MGELITALKVDLLQFVVSALSLLIIIAVVIGHRRSNSQINCLQLITNKDGILDANSMGQFCGVVIAVWAPAYTTYLGKLDPVIFGLSLTYLAGVKGYASYLRHKQDLTKIEIEAEKKEKD
jgi:hypothetical protein